MGSYVVESLFEWSLTNWRNPCFCANCPCFVPVFVVLTKVIHVARRAQVKLDSGMKIGFARDLMLDGDWEF